MFSEYEFIFCLYLLSIYVYLLCNEWRNIVMSKIYEDNLLIIGNILLVCLNKVFNGKVLVKIEVCNLSFSVKCWIGVNMIWEVEK